MNDLTVSLDPASSVPLYEQIYQHIKKEIQSGGLSFGTRLPSTRNLAGYLQVSRTTADMAYSQLVSEGYIEAVPCRGYFVCELEGLYCPGTESKERHTEKKPEEKKYRYDFSPSGVDLNSFPYGAWRKLSKNILMADNKKIFQLGDPQGEYALRCSIADYLHQARGVLAEPEQIVVGAGNDFLLLLLCSMLGTGQKIAMESPTYRKAYDLLGNLSNEIRIVEMDEAGMRIDSLEASGADIAYVMPSHQFPLGIVMPVGRRMQLLEWAAKSERRFIIEDDYDSEFRYRGKPIPALQGFDRSGRVIYIGTFSKSIAPAIRVSYLVLPDRLMELYRRRGRLISSTVSRVDQLLIAGFLDDGYYERHLNKMRAIYKSRHDVLLEEMRGFQGICQISGENAGVHILLTFKNGMTEQEAIDRAAKEGVRVYGLSRYYIRQGMTPASPGGEQQIRISGGIQSPSDIRSAGMHRDSESKTSAGADPNPAHKTRERVLNGKDDSNKTSRQSHTVILGYANVEEAEIRAAAGCLRKAWS